MCAGEYNFFFINDNSFGHFKQNFKQCGDNFESLWTLFSSKSSDLVMCVESPMNSIHYDELPVTVTKHVLKSWTRALSDG